ncbi:MAG TPA: glycosyltransferase family 2 protein [Patescibacteria group bacterium]
MIETHQKPSISAVIIAKNEDQMIANCIETLRWCDEIVVIDNGSEDATASLAESLGARVVNFKSPHFDKLREEGLKRTKTDWIFYVDADERVTPILAKEIMVQLETSPASAIRMRRQNVLYGSHFHHGGWQNEYVTRVFKRKDLKNWQGVIHESPVFEGELITVHSPLTHFTHRSVIQGLSKTIAWTPLEAKLLYEANVSPVTVMTLLRKGIMEFIRRAYFQKGYQDGMPGMIEALTQGINRMLVYMQVWELQQNPSIEDLYKKEEVEIANLWQKEPVQKGMAL